MYKKINLLNVKPNTSKITIIIILFIIILIVLSIKIKVYKTQKVTGIVTCDEKCYIETNIPSTKSEILNKNINIVYEHQIYKANKVNLEDIIDNGDNIYLRIKIDSDLKQEKNNIIEFKIIYDRQRIITILKNIMKG